MKPNVLKILGVGLAVVGAAVSVVTSIVAEKNQELKIAEKVAEAFDKAKE
jgi:hypothetical protein